MSPMSPFNVTKMSPVALTQKQVVAVNALANGLPVEKVALLAEVSKRTVLRWKKMDIFQAELKRARHSVAKASIEIIRESKESVFQDSRNALKLLLGKSFKVLNEIIDNPEAAERDKLKAIDTIGNWLGVKYMNEVNTAIEMLESRGFRVVVEVEDVKHLGNEMN